VNSPIFPWLRESFVPMLVNKAAQYSEPDQDVVSRAALLVEQVKYQNALPSVPPSQQMVLLCAHYSQVCYSMWWLTKYCVDHVDIFFISAEMGNEECTEMQLKFEELLIPYVFITTPKVDRTGLNLAAGNHVVITTKFWVLNEQLQGMCTSWPARAKRCHTPMVSEYGFWRLW